MSTLSTGLVKTPHTTENMDQQELMEIARCTLDPIYFARNYCYIRSESAGGKVIFDMYDYQERLIQSYHDNRFCVALMPRQSGKTTCAAAYLLWYAMYKPDSTILVVSNKKDAALEIMSYVRTMYENCPDHIRAGVTLYNRGSIEFDNGSRIISQATTETSGRGMALSLIYADEFSFVPPNIATEFWTSLSPTLATGGKCIITSTPNQDDDQFARIWKLANRTVDEYGNKTELGINGFKAVTAAWDEHPDRDEDWAQRERASIGEERFRREFGLEFITFDETLINSVFLADMETEREPYKMVGQVRWYDIIKDGETVLLSLDPSLGTGGNNSAIQIFTLHNMRQIAEWQHNKTKIQDQIKIMKTILEEIEELVPNSDIYYSVENNTLGEAALISISEMGEDNIPGIFLSEPKRKGRVRKFRKGFNTTHSTKISACSKLKRWIEDGYMTVYSGNLIRELKTFIAKGNTYEAKEGETDDLVSALLIIIRMSMVLVKYDEKAFIDLKDSFDDQEDYKHPLPVGIL